MAVPTWRKHSVSSCLAGLALMVSGTRGLNWGQLLRGNSWGGLRADCVKVWRDGQLPVRAVLWGGGHV